jgi:hypothetical protein
MTAIMAALAVVALIRRTTRGPVRDALDDRRVMLAFRDAWDLPPGEIENLSRLGPGRLYAAIARLESVGLLDGYWQGGRGSSMPGKRRITLTQAGRDRVFDLEREEIEDRSGE